MKPLRRASVHVARSAWHFALPSTQVDASEARNPFATTLPANGTTLAGPLSPLASLQLELTGMDNRWRPGIMGGGAR